MTGVTLSFASRRIAKQLEGMKKRTGKTITQVRSGAVAALREAAQPVFDLSQVYCPTDTGQLLESGKMQVLFTPKKRDIKVIISYGPVIGPNSQGADYAVVVHERLDLMHEPPATAKFLQIAFNAYADELPRTFSTNLYHWLQRNAPKG